MRAVLTNFGSRGDVQPYLALAIELRCHGHSPVVAMSPEYGSWVRSYGLEFCPLGPSLLEAQRSTIAAEISAADSDHSSELMLPFILLVKSALPETFEQLKTIAGDADVLICGPEHAIAQMVREVLGLPLALIQLGHFDLPVWPAVVRECVAFLNPFRAQIGLSQPDDYVIRDPQLELYAMSRHVISRPAGWPANRHLTGFFFLHDDDWQSDPDLLRFLESGEPPVVICFSSMIHEKPDEMTELILAAMKAAGYRAIIQQGWSGLGRRPLPPDIYETGSVPHSWLFRRAICVVHHGGAGTVASAFRAGVPSVFIPHYSDQPLWAKHFHNAGYALPPIPLTQLSAKRLALAVAMTLSRPKFRQKAADLGRKIEAENGVAQARQLIERLLRETDGGRHKSIAKTGLLQ
jgi:sterol 3beta-glucosyltransferase